MCLFGFSISFVTNNNNNIYNNNKYYYLQPLCRVFKIVSRKQTTLLEYVAL
jgi:hypothetical protein